MTAENANNLDDVYTDWMAKVCVNAYWTEWEFFHRSKYIPLKVRFISQIC